MRLKTLDDVLLHHSCNLNTTVLSLADPVTLAFLLFLEQAGRLLL